MVLDDMTPEEITMVLRARDRGGNPEPAQPGNPLPDPDRKWGEAPRPNPATVTRLIPATEWVKKQISTLQSVGETNYRSGITRPKKDPIAAGIAAQPAYEAAMRDPAVLARRAANLRKTSIDEWASMAERVGAARLVQGVTERQFKVERFVTAYHGKLAAHLGRIDAMANVTPADRERRMVENLKGLRALKGQA